MTTSGGMGKSVWLAGAAALVALAALGDTVPAAASPGSFSPPASPLLLTRTLIRPLPDGNTITTRRSYEVQIKRDGAGYRVEGRLVEVTVDAPPSLAALADIERARPDNGMFPIMLDTQGLIIGGGTRVSDGSLDRAATVAVAQMGSSGLPAVDMLQAQAFVTQLRGRSPRSLWPADTFNPAPGKRSESRSVPVPGGGQSQITIEIEASGPGTHGRIAELERLVTTDLDGNKRLTRERWQLIRTSSETGR